MAETTIGEALQKLFKSAHWETRLNDIRIRENWELIMGKTIAKYTDKVVFRDGVLTIYTAVGPLKQELQSHQLQIIQRINEHFKTAVVKSVRIR